MSIAGQRSIVECESDGETLLTRVRGGGRDAHGKLYERCERRARQYARSLLGSEADAADAVGDVFARILEAVERDYRLQHTFTAHLFASVRHECGRSGRSNSRQARAPLGGHGDVSDPDGDHAADIVEAAVVRAALAGLPADMRDLLLLTEVARLRPHVVAVLLDALPATVAGRAMRARRPLPSACLDQHRSARGGPRRAGSAWPETRASLVGYLRGSIEGPRRG
jgi:RNA polymerase sigma factor (sigma-70 family)